MLRPYPYGSASGFSIIEMVMVFLVLAIAAAAVAPMLGDTDAGRLRAAADLLAADVAFAQGESIARGDDPCVIVFNTADNTYHLARASSPGIPITNPIDKRPYMVRFGTGRASQLAGVTLHSATVGADNRLGFKLYGQLDQTTPAIITLVAGQRKITLTLDSTTGEPTIGAVVKH